MKVLIVYYSIYGHIYQLAQGVEQGSRVPSENELAGARF